MRLACLCAILERSAQVRLQDLEAALALWDYVQASAEYLFGDTLGDAVADTLLGHLRDAGPSGLTRTAIRDLFDRNASAAEVTRALETLEGLDLATCHVQRTGGRPAECWVATTKTTEATKVLETPIESRPLVVSVVPRGVEELPDEPAF